MATERLRDLSVDKEPTNGVSISIILSSKMPVKLE